MGEPTDPTSSAELPLTEATLQLIADAREEAARLQHEYVGTEHLVLALSRQAADATLLVALGVDPQRVHTSIGDIVRRGSAALERTTERPFTMRTKRSFALAAESARELGHTRVDIAHVLVGLLRERSNIGAQVLTGEGLTVERADEYARRSAVAARPE
jgi:ATP-dependent Clp protease ATP-binding subunit ClpC